MSIERVKTVIPKFPLRLMPSVRQSAELYSEKEGVSLNQFINVAVAERVMQLRQQEWAANRKKPSKASIARVLEILNRSGGEAPQPGDEVPAEYLAARARLEKNRQERA